MYLFDTYLICVSRDTVIANSKENVLQVFVLRCAESVVIHAIYRRQSYKWTDFVERYSVNATYYLIFTLSRLIHIYITLLD